MNIFSTATLATAALLAGLIATPATDARADGLPFADPGENAARIDGSIGRRAQDIYPVEIIAIDGRNIAPRPTIWLKPGEYELTVRADVRNPPGLSSVRRQSHNADGRNLVEVVVEAGKTYHVGSRHDRSNDRNPYQAVLYRVE